MRKCTLLIAARGYNESVVEITEFDGWGFESVFNDLVDVLRPGVTALLEGAKLSITWVSGDGMEREVIYQKTLDDPKGFAEALDKDKQITRDDVVSILSEELARFIMMYLRTTSNPFLRLLGNPWKQLTHPALRPRSRK